MDVKPLTIVQARTASQRLPEKVLLKLGGKTILEHVLGRLAIARRAGVTLGEVIVATGARARDDRVERIVRDLDGICVRSSERDVLHRFHTAALTELDATHVVRITADCPLLCPELLRRVIDVAANEPTDYATVVGAPTGLAQELISTTALHQAWKLARDPSDREHVVPYVIERSGVYDVRLIPASDRLFDQRQLRLTLDTSEDWDLLKALHHASGGELFDLSTDDVLELLGRDRHLMALAARAA